MTIGIGFKCSDGLVLATDTQYTRGSIKTHGPKLFPIVGAPERSDLAVVVAGAGHVAFMKRAIEKISVSLASLSSPSMENVRVLIEDELVAFYRKHIYPHPKHQDVSFSLLVGAWTVSDGWNLFRTAETAVEPVVSATGYDSIGSGQYVSEYALDLVFEGGLNVDHAKILAAFCIKAAKDFVDYCGGKTRIFVLTADGAGGHIKTVSPIEIEHRENYATELYEIVRDLLQLLDTDGFSDDEVVGALTNIVRDSIIGFRAKQREIQQRRASRMKGVT